MPVHHTYIILVLASSSDVGGIHFELDLETLIKDLPQVDGTHGPRTLTNVSMLSRHSKDIHDSYIHIMRQL